MYAVVVCCGVLQCIAVCCSVSPYMHSSCMLLVIDACEMQCGVVCCSVLQ